MLQPLLHGIGEPSALRSLSREELGRVAQELRDELIALGAAGGGHFAGSLGVVELTVALHTVFETPDDRVIWDVGHQAYGHKALTGRREALARVKRSDGPSGFLRRAESPFDVFGAGHAGTSISAGMSNSGSFFPASSLRSARLSSASICAFRSASALSM